MKTNTIRFAASVAFSLTVATVSMQASTPASHAALKPTTTVRILPGSIAGTTLTTFPVTAQGKALRGAEIFNRPATVATLGLTGGGNCSIWSKIRQLMNGVYCGYQGL